MAKVYVTLEVEVPGELYDGACAILDDADFDVSYQDDNGTHILNVSVAAYSDRLES